MLLRIPIYILILLLPQLIFAQSVAINHSGNPPDSNAILDIQSDSKGVLIPRLTTVQRNFIASPTPGLLVYDSDTESFWFKESGGWIELVDNGKGLRDQDQDTRVEVEATPDDDTIRFFTGGIEFGKMDGRTFHLQAPGSSLFVGRDAGSNDDGTDNKNTFLGQASGHENTTGSDNVFIGQETGYSNLNGAKNTFIGQASGHENTSGSGNVFMGNAAGYSNLTGGSNIMIGNEAGYTNTSGFDNVFLGFLAGAYNTNGHRNFFIGTASGLNNSSGNDNIAMGTESLYTNTSGHDNIAIGRLAMTANETGFENTAIGHYALSQNRSFHNSAVGHSSLSTNTSGNSNTAMGYQSLYSNFNGGSNSAFGVHSLYSNTTGYSNTALGHSALYFNDDGFSNVGVGGSALYRNDGGSDNVAVGIGAGLENTSGNENVIIGQFANQFNQNGDQNTIIGSYAGRGGSYHNKTGNVFIGYNAGYSEQESNKLYIENSNSPDPLIYGEFDTDLVGINGSLGIGTTQPDVRLHVAGGTDASLAGGGYFMTNSTNSTNIVIDDNEIIARNNGSASILHLQTDGGDFHLHSAMPVLQEMIVKSDGKTGIGLDNPEDKLHIRSDGVEHAFRVQVNSSTKLRIYNSGTIAVSHNPGGGPPFAFQLPNNTNDSIGTARAFDWVTYSDARIKSDVRDLPYGLESVLQLRPKQYVHHDSKYHEDGSFQLKTDTGSEDIGFLAQDLHAVIPEIVHPPKDPEHDLWAVSYQRLIPILVKAIQELNEQVESQRLQIRSLEQVLHISRESEE